MKKYLAVILCFLLVMSVLPINTFATEIQPTNITINFDGTTYTGEGEGDAWSYAYCPSNGNDGELTLSNGYSFTFTGTTVKAEIANYGIIESGVFSRGFVNKSSGIINDGVFKSYAGISNYGIINGGRYSDYASVFNWGTINNGMFTKEVVNKNSSGNIYGGYFDLAIDNTKNGTIDNTSGNIYFKADISGLKNLKVISGVETVDGGASTAYYISYGEKTAISLGLSGVDSKDYHIPKYIEVNGVKVTRNDENSTYTFKVVAPVTINGDVTDNLITINYNGTSFSGDGENKYWEYDTNTDILLLSEDVAFKFEGAAIDKGVMNNGTIISGTFTNAIDNIGTISGGSYGNIVSNIGTISGGYFKKGIENNGGEIAKDGKVKILFVANLTNVELSENNSAIEKNGDELCFGYTGSDISVNLSASTGYLLPNNATINGSEVAIKNESVKFNTSDSVTLSAEGVKIPDTTPTPVPTDKIKIKIPSLVCSDYVYTGSTVSAMLNGFDSNLMTIEGNTATEIGQYKLIIRLKDNEKYQWDSETNVNGGWQYTWNIIKNDPKDTVKDTTSGIIIKGEGGVSFDPSTYLSVTLEPKSDYDRYKDEIERIAKGKNIICLYDIKLMLDGEEIQPNGKVTVSIPLTEEQKSFKDTQIIYIDKEGNVNLIDGKVENGMLVFTTDHFSLYGAMGTPTANPTASPSISPSPSPSTSPSPTTGDASNYTVFFIILGVAALAIIILLVDKRKFHKNV